MHCWRGWPAGENAVPSSLPDRLQIPASLPRRHRHHRPGARLRVRERKWCRHANRWGASRWARGYFATISRLGDGVFWYLLMGALVLWDGLAGLAASAHMAATGAAASGAMSEVLAGSEAAGWLWAFPTAGTARQASRTTIHRLRRMETSSGSRPAGQSRANRFRMVATLEVPSPGVKD